MSVRVSLWLEHRDYWTDAHDAAAAAAAIRSFIDRAVELSTLLVRMQLLGHITCR